MLNIEILRSYAVPDTEASIMEGTMVLFPAVVPARDNAVVPDHGIAILGNA